MPMPNRHIQDANAYRYAYQGQEKDPETGKEAFELRLWDGRIGRWLTTDPYGQYSSPYLGMGNNPISRIDPNGGSDGGPGDPPTINLDTVVITGHCGSNCGNNTPHIANIDFRSFDPSYPTWTSSFKGNLNDWNEVNGTNFKDPYAAYDYWKELLKQRKMNAIESKIHSATNQAAEIILETGLTFSPFDELELIGMGVRIIGGKIGITGVLRMGNRTFSFLTKTGDGGYAIFHYKKILANNKVYQFGLHNHPLKRTVGNVLHYHKGIGNQGRKHLELFTGKKLNIFGTTERLNKFGQKLH